MRGFVDSGSQFDTHPPTAGAIHYQLPDGTECGKRAEGAVKLTTGGYVAKGALPSVQAPLTCAH